VHGWSVEYDKTIDGKRHTVARGFGHALLAPIVAHTFTEPELSASVSSEPASRGLWHDVRSAISSRGHILSCDLPRGAPL
jgi:hypothetical protein